MRPHAPSGSATPAVSDRTGDYIVLPDWSPSPPDLYGCPGSREPARPALSREMRGPMPLGVSDALASVTCRDLCVSPPGQRRRPSATGRGTSLVLLLSAVLQAPVRTTRTGQRRCRDVPPKVPDSRTSSRSATRGTTSLADFPGCAKSPSLEP